MDFIRRICLFIPLYHLVDYYPSLNGSSNSAELLFSFPGSTSTADSWSELGKMKFSNGLGTVQRQLVRLKEEEIIQIIRDSLSPTQVKWYANFN